MIKFSKSTSVNSYLFEIFSSSFTLPYFAALPLKTGKSKPKFVVSRLTTVVLGNCSVDRVRCKNINQAELSSFSVCLFEAIFIRVSTSKWQSALYVIHNRRLWRSTPFVKNLLFSAF